MSYGDLVAELLEILAEDAEVLGSAHLLARMADMAAEGTSAHRQRETYASAIEAGASPQQALLAVLDRLIDEFSNA